MLYNQEMYDNGEMMNEGNKGDDLKERLIEHPQRQEEVRQEAQAQQINNVGFLNKIFGCFCCKGNPPTHLQELNEVQSSLQSISSQSIINNDDIYAYLPEQYVDFDLFAMMLQAKLGIIFLYQDNDKSEIDRMIQSIINNSVTLETIQQNCIIFITSNTSAEGKKILSAIQDLILMPSILYCFNTVHSDIFASSSIKARLEGMVNIGIFNNVLLNTLNLKIQNEMYFPAKSNDNQSFIDDQPDIDIDQGNGRKLTNAEIIQQQERDLRRLEKEQRERSLAEENRLREENRRQNSIVRRSTEREQKRLKLIQSLPIEPKEINETTTKICFRYPDGETRKERIFYRNDKMQLLYDYVETLGDEIYTEPEMTTFTLIQSFPFKSYDDKTKTLHDEHLYPNAIIQIKEE